MIEPLRQREYYHVDTSLGQGDEIENEVGRSRKSPVLMLISGGRTRVATISTEQNGSCSYRESGLSRSVGSGQRIVNQENWGFEFVSTSPTCRLSGVRFLDVLDALA